MDNPMQFIDKWNQTKAKSCKIYLRPEAHGDQLYGVEFRFNGQSLNINEDKFISLCSRVFSDSKGTMQITTDIGSFHSGILYATVLFCNHGYSPKIICRTLDFILDEIFPDLAK